MKIITNICRFLVGGLFIFSGFIKSNDPKGTGIKFNEYFDVFAARFEVPKDTITIAVKDNFDVNDVYSYTLKPDSKDLNMQLNQAAPSKILFDGDTDSSYGCMVYVVKDGEEMFSYFYTLEDTILLPKVNLKVSISGASTKTLVAKTTTICYFIVVSTVPS